jgi:hypothetical protein
MARGSAQKARPKTIPDRDRPRRPKAKAPGADGKLAERVAALEREREALRAELERTLGRLRKLEVVNSTARDRISWALDTLHSVLDGKD